MSDIDFNAQSFALKSKPALGGKAPMLRNGVTITPLASTPLVHVLGKPGDDTLAALLRDVVADDATALRFVAPGQWFVVGKAMETLAARLKSKAPLVDQSSGRVRIAVTGPNAVRVLAKGTAVDLSSATFTAGQSAMTLVGHIGAQITRMENDSFEVAVLRGFAESLWDELDHMSREFI